MKTRKRILIDVSNLSIHSKKFIRTGIQEVVYKTLLGLVEVRHEYPEYEIILLPQLPRRYGNLLKESTTVPYQNPAAFILEGIEEKLKLPSSEVWGFDLKSKDYRLSNDQTLEWLDSADAIHIQSMVNVGPMMERLHSKGTPGAENLSMTIYDLVPTLFPEYCDYGLYRWFQGTYLPSIGKYVNHAICISRHTARDLLENSLTKNIPKLSALPLPFELAPAQQERPWILKKLGLEKKEYLVFLGSLEPRKNFEALLNGFEVFRRIAPFASIKLVLVGATGWKNFAIEKRIRNSPVASEIIRAGYLSDDELGELIRSATALAMVSHYEGYGLPVAQAFSLGTPIITTLGSSLPEACGGNAVFVEPHDSWSVSAGIHLAMKQTQMTPFKDLRDWTWANYCRNLLSLVVGVGSVRGL